MNEQERYNPDNPHHIELTHKDGKFVGYYDCERDMLLLFARGQVMRYPRFSVMVEKVKARAALIGNGPQAIAEPAVVAE